MADTVPYEVSSALSKIIYDYDGKAAPGLTIGDMLSSSTFKSSNTPELSQIISANNLSDVEILDTSWSHTNANGEPLYGSLSAITCKQGDEVFVVYCGTLADGWGYNAVSAYGTTTSQMQDWSLEYFDQTVKNHVGDDTTLHVTGHSQGGNDAMYVTIASRYAEKVKTCIAVDGPGFNRETIDKITAERGEAFMDQQIDKMYAINGENDPVHNTGEVHLISKEHTVTVPTPTAADFGQCHSIETHFKDGKIDIQRDERGEIVSVPEGTISAMTRKMLENMVKYLPKEDRYESAVAAMAIMEYLVGNKEPSNLSDIGAFADLLDDAVPLLLITAIQDPVTFIKLLSGEDSKLTQWALEHPVLTVLITVYAASIVYFIAEGLETILEFVDYLSDIYHNIVDMVNSAKEFVLSTLQAVKEAIIGFKEYLRSLTPGSKYAASNPYFKADPALMRSYADRLKSVNSRLATLDIDLDSLYQQVGLLDILDILQANILISYNGRVWSAEQYLRSAATTIETADNTALGYMGG